jgi:hypothetical protein
MAKSNHRESNAMVRSRRNSGATLDFGAATGAQMNSIVMFLRSDTAFDPEILAAMGSAFDLACSACPGDDASFYREEIATRIIGLARRGVRDPEQLYECALTSTSLLQMLEDTSDSCRSAPTKTAQAPVPRVHGGDGS